MYNADDVILKGNIKNLAKSSIQSITVTMTEEHAVWYKEFIILPEDIDDTTGDWYITLSAEETAQYNSRYKLRFQCYVQFASGLHKSTNCVSKDIKDILNNPYKNAK